jgi:hypothetical protein
LFKDAWQLVRVAVHFAWILIFAFRHILFRGRALRQLTAADGSSLEPAFFDWKS